MMVIVLLFPISFIHYGRGVKVVEPYMGGANLPSNVGFLGSAGATQSAVTHNYYLRALFNEAWLSRWGVIFCAGLLAAMVVVAWL